MKLQRLLSLTRQAIDAYHMINPDDHIALGLSGGKDSLTLLYALANLRKFYPSSFQLSAITVDLGLGNLFLEGLSVMNYLFHTKLYLRKSGKFFLISARNPIPALYVLSCGKVL